MSKQIIVSGNSHSVVICDEKGRIQYETPEQLADCLESVAKNLRRGTPQNTEPSKT
jgi:hypothetical protein